MVKPYGIALVTRVGAFFGFDEVRPNQTRKMTQRVSPTLSRMQAIQDSFSHIPFKVLLQHKITPNRLNIYGAILFGELHELEHCIHTL